jgi:hypothetical protein
MLNDDIIVCCTRRKEAITHQDRSKQANAKKKKAARIMPSSMLEDAAMVGSSPSLGRLDRCAGCNATDVSLLACDDLDGKGGPTDPSNRSRYVKWLVEQYLFFVCLLKNRH